MGLAGVETLALYGPRDVRSLVDHLGYFYERPHFLEWCFGNTMLTESMAFDMDGVICEDVTAPDGTEEYEYFIDHARPLYPPRVPVVIITAREERYRDRTLAWLKRYGVTARELIMWPTGGEWSRGRIAEWKSAVLKDIKSRYGLHYYVESSPEDALVIANAAKMPVICPAAGQVFNIDTRGTDGHWS